MPIIQRVTNQNKLVAEKVNYFLDRITHAVSYAGREWSFELESPASLVKKVVFRLQEDTEYRLEYFDNYFKQSFFTTDTFWNHYPTYNDVKKVVSLYNLPGKSKNEKKSLIDSAEFRSNLINLHRDLKHKMPRDLMTAVIGNIACEHKLQDLMPGTKETHASFFCTAALILVSEYYFQGFSKSEIREIIREVFSKDLNSFPFPSNIKTIADKKKHLKEGLLINQLHGFTNAFELKKQSGIILVKVYGALFPPDFEFKYNKIKFFGKEHPQILRIKGKMKKDDVESFFVTGEYILAAAEIPWRSADSLLENLKNAVRQELVFLSAVLSRDFSVDTTPNYVWLSLKMQYKGMGWSTKTFDRQLSKHDLQELTDNGFEALRKVRGIAVDWFLRNEHLFIMAHKGEVIEDYWLYLETLLSYNQKEKKIKGPVSSIILSNEHLFKQRRLITTISDCFSPFNGGIDLLKVTQERWRKIFTEIKRGKIAKEMRNVKYPFLQELISEYDTPLDSKYYKKAKEYYQSILTEAYEYRNFIVHKGLESEVSRDKLKVTLPNIVIRTRWTIFKALKNGKHDMPFDLLIEELVKEGEGFLKE